VHVHDSDLKIVARCSFRMLAPGGQATINIQFIEKERLKSMFDVLRPTAFSEYTHALVACLAIVFLSGKEPVRSEGMRIAPANAPRTLRRQLSRQKTIQTD
jgi:hypothetical protein